MRDYLLVLILPLLLYAAIRKPFLSISFWIWSALVPPFLWAYGGISTSVRWNFLFAAVTIASFAINKCNKKPPSNGIFILAVIFFVHCVISSMLNNGYGPYVWFRFDLFWRTLLLFFFIAVVIRKEIHFEAVAWGITLSFGALAMIEGAKFIVSFGGHNIFGLTPAFNDNNLSALASLMCIPVAIFLARQYKENFYFRNGLYGLAFLNVMFVLGTDSRGAFLGLAVFCLAYWVKSKNKMRDGFFMSLGGLVALAILSDEWFNRMETIGDANEDGSFQGRLKSWKLAMLMAIRHPFFGGGFDSTFTNISTINSLIAEWDTLSWIPSATLNVGDTVFVAHSIYFQVLADHGFLGAMWYGFMILISLKTLGIIAKTSSVFWQVNLAEMIRLSLIAFLTTGAALSSAYNDLFFALVGMTVALAAAVKKDEQERALARIKTVQPARFANENRHINT
ncbi:putative O-glycosylation ligase, exosortase A system-associated [Alteromonas sp. Cnat3-28]|uniref:putative O-glycosylation ligase, exosortase A system-associated n=1 Tax=Alteromonas sp. Cnat3-28 TaxID=2917729 RepID=UPI001EF41002|nr:putative O-glycosylation ligase, exosortase A system-associated [Alteromonas sp. Cnat3-28]MCG7644921.1 putative O-glycosylation ligase, exosortase A system-associated [Alteromonas sp. Cnat3-28]